MAPLFPQHLKGLPQQLVELLRSHTNLQPSLRRHLTQSLILLRNRKMIELVEILPVLMELQNYGDRTLRKLAFLHIVQDIRRMNLKHKNEQKNKALQNLLFKQLQDEDETKAKRALVVLAEMHRRKLWIDERSSNAICAACFHKSSRIMIAALRFLLGYDRENKQADDSDSDDGDDNEKSPGLVTVSREAIYKANHKGTASSQKKKQAKLQRVMRSMKKQQRLESNQNDNVGYVPLKHVVDPQKFAEKFFERLRSCNERFEVKLMMMSLISRAIGIHKLILLNFYPFLQKYIQPHQRDVTHLLAAAVQACHDLVPPDAVEMLVRQLVNQFVHDRARPEVIAVGLNVVREICIRIPLIMTEELLRDLAAYKKSREKAVASAARSIIAVYRQVWPSLLEKKDRGKGANLQAKPRAFGAVEISSDVPGADLLRGDAGSDDGAGDLSESGDSDSDKEGSDGLGESRGWIDRLSDELVDCGKQEGTELEGDDDEAEDDDDNTDEDEDDDDEEEDEEEDEEGDVGVTNSEDEGVSKTLLQTPTGVDCDTPVISEADTNGRSRKRKPGVDSPPIDEQSLRKLRKIAAARVSVAEAVDGIALDGDGIFSNEDFQRIRKLQAKKAANTALVAHGMAKGGKKRDVEVKLPDSQFHSAKRVDPSDLEPMMRKRREKEERIAAARAGREDRPAYGSRTGVKNKKTGGTSNKQKDKQKGLPLAAKRAKIARSKDQKRRKGRSSAKQFRGKKAWKQ
eukprot:TRINITY_DN24490_c0_g1_i1.p1 TRINITY_DN24490_c0_g1~~TRINITY_DN24490_c0_g1_i1.p1  ORF type:complete len:742 (-),score=193.00 TRINITY_DN24490_c0_g1_i1:170-2395(-)